MFITRRRSCSFAEYWKHFMACFSDVHASGCNSAGSKWIWILSGAGRDRFWARSAQKREQESEPKFCFLFLSCKYRTTLPIFDHQISRNLHTRRGSERWWILSENICENLPVMALFSKKINFYVNIINDFRLQAVISAKWLQILKSHDWLAMLECWLSI